MVKAAAVGLGRHAAFQFNGLDILVLSFVIVDLAITSDP